MKKLLAILLFICFTFALIAQEYVVSERVDDLKKELAGAKDDTTKLALLSALFMEYLFSYPDSSANYVQQEIVLAKQMKSDIRLALAYGDYSGFFEMIGDYPKALYFNQEALKLAEKSKSWSIIADIH